ncbi:MAG: hypothetical protein ABJA67_16730 [Chthonomonadales bacterium]
MKSTYVESTTIIGMALLAVSSTVYAQTPQEIITRNQAVMKGAKTYQAVMSMTQNMGAQGSMMLNVEAKIAGKKSMMKISPTGQATGLMAMGAAMANVEVYNDGTKMITYMKSLNTYSEQPSKAGSSTPFDFTKSLTANSGSKWKLNGVVKVNGKDAFSLSLSMPAGKTGSTQTTNVFIAKSNYHLLKMTTVSKINAGPQGPMSMASELLVKSEKLNDPLSDSVFKFVPPSGAKLQSMKGMMGGMAGAVRAPKKK